MTTTAYLPRQLGRPLRSRRFVAGIAAEVDRLGGAARRSVSQRGLAGLGLTASLCATVALLAVLQNLHVGADALDAMCRESAVLPLPVALARLPGSMLAPALNLPVWGALLQVLVVFGLGEVVLGRRRTLMVALVGHTAATMGARALLWFGVDQQLAAVRDTGPSAAVVALTVYLCCRRRAPRLALGVVIAMLVEVALRPNLAGYEHLVALCCGLVCAAPRLWARRSAAPTPADRASVRPAPWSLVTPRSGKRRPR